MYAAESTRSLAAARTGESVEVRHILFEGLRRYCADLDITEGQTIRCRAATPSQLILETPHGRTVALELDWARFIEVAAAASIAVPL